MTSKTIFPFKKKGKKGPAGAPGEVTPEQAHPQGIRLTDIIFFLTEEDIRKKRQLMCDIETVNEDRRREAMIIWQDRLKNRKGSGMEL